MDSNLFSWEMQSSQQIIFQPPLTFNRTTGIFTAGLQSDTYFRTQEPEGSFFFYAKHFSLSLSNLNEYQKANYFRNEKYFIALSVLKKNYSQ